MLRLLSIILAFALIASGCGNRIDGVDDEIYKDVEVVGIENHDGYSSYIEKNSGLRSTKSYQDLVIEYNDNIYTLRSYETNYSEGDKIDVEASYCYRRR